MNAEEEKTTWTAVDFLPFLCALPHLLSPPEIPFLLPVRPWQTNQKHTEQLRQRGSEMDLGSRGVVYVTLNELVANSLIHTVLLSFSKRSNANLHHLQDSQ